MLCEPTVLGLMTGLLVRYGCSLVRQAHILTSAVITNSIHAVVVALAAAAVGAMFSSTAPDMGASGILDRYRQVTPTFLFVDTEVTYAGKQINLVPKIQELAMDLSSGYGLQKVVLIPSTITQRYPEASIPHRYDVYRSLFANQPCLSVSPSMISSQREWRETLCLNNCHSTTHFGFYILLEPAARPNASYILQGCVLHMP